MQQSPSWQAGEDIMEPDGTLPCSQEPGIGPNPKPDASSPRLPTLFP